VAPVPRGVKVSKKGSRGLPLGEARRTVSRLRSLSDFPQRRAPKNAKRSLGCPALHALSRNARRGDRRVTHAPPPRSLLQRRLCAALHTKRNSVIAITSQREERL
jgi:hypothetical protein